MWLVGMPLVAWWALLRSLPRLSWLRLARRTGGQARRRTGGTRGRRRSGGHGLTFDTGAPRSVPAFHGL
jgi:hypothetical protein